MFSVSYSFGVFLYTERVVVELLCWLFFWVAV